MISCNTATNTNRSQVEFELVTSAKDVMLCPAFVCLFVCVSVSNFTENHRTDLNEKFTTDVRICGQRRTYIWEVIRHSASGYGSMTF